MPGEWKQTACILCECNCGVEVRLGGDGRTFERFTTRGVTAEELSRAKADLKSRVVMQTETSGARASALVNDWWNLGRLRTLDEIKAEVDRVTSDDIVRHVSSFPVQPVTLVTLGPAPVEGVSLA